LEKIKRRIRIKDATNLTTKARIPESVIHKPFTTRDHYAAVTKALVFQKRQLFTATTLTTETNH